MMDALTIWQPWASLIAIGAKPYEFRGWQPPARLIGQGLGIHAGARPVRIAEVVDLIERLETPDPADCPCLHAEPALDLLRKVLAGLRATPAGGLLDEEPPFRLPLSCMLGIARVGRPKRGDECAREFGAGGNDSDRQGTFNYGWPLTDFRPFLPPIPMKGAQGLWKFQP